MLFAFGLDLLRHIQPNPTGVEDGNLATSAGKSFSDHVIGM